MKELRTNIRSMLYNSSWGLESVIGRCQEKGIPPDKVAIALARCHKFVEGFSPKKMAGALVVIFNLAKVLKKDF
jgi:hypothetical protein